MQEEQQEEAKEGEGELNLVSSTSNSRENPIESLGENHQDNTHECQQQKHAYYEHEEGLVEQEKENQQEGAKEKEMDADMAMHSSAFNNDNNNIRNKIPIVQSQLRTIENILNNKNSLEVLVPYLEQVLGQVIVQCKSVVADNEIS